MSSSRRKKDARTSPAGASSGDGSEGFEDQLRRLELLVERMEGEDLRLEEAIGLFEEGMGLSKSLLDRLETAEKRVELLVRKSRTEVEKRSLDAGKILSGGSIRGDSGEDDDEDFGDDAGDGDEEEDDRQ